MTRRQHYEMIFTLREAKPSDAQRLFEVSCDEGDLLFDEIGSVLKIKDMQLKKKELLESVEMYYKVFFLKQDASSLLDEE